MFRSTPRLLFRSGLAVFKPVTTPLYAKPLYSSVLDTNLYIPSWDNETSTKRIRNVEKRDTPIVDKVDASDIGQKLNIVFDSSQKSATWIDRLPAFLKPVDGTTYYETTHISAIDPTTSPSRIASAMATPSLLQRVLYGTPECVMLKTTTTAITTSPEQKDGGFWHRVLHGVPESVLEAEPGKGGVAAVTTTVVAAVKNDGQEIEIDKAVKIETDPETVEKEM